MCSLQEHTARSNREHEAQQQEPIYTQLAHERGIEWEPPTLATFAEELRSQYGDLITLSFEQGVEWEPITADPEKSAARSFLDQTAL
jgi:hypothetical protein